MSNTINFAQANFIYIKPSQVIQKRFEKLYDFAHVNYFSREH